MPTRILIADDQPLIRCGIRSQLSPYQEFEVVGEVTNGHEATELALNVHPDVLLLEVSIPSAEIYRIIQRYSNGIDREMKVLVLTYQRSSALIEKSLKEGARGYVLKEESPDVLIEAIRMVTRGKIWLSPASAELVATKLARKNNKMEILSERELEILKRLGQGQSNYQIAEQLCIAERTVRYHMEKVLNKLCVSNRIEAVARATQNGWFVL